MNYLVQEWRFGSDLFVRLVVMLFCAAAGPALLLATYFWLVAMGVRIPTFLLITAQALAIALISPYLLARYAAYCGYRSADGKKA